MHIIRYTVNDGGYPEGYILSPLERPPNHGMTSFIPCVVRRLRLMERPLGSTDHVASREVRRGLLRTGLACLQLCHFAFEPAQPAVEDVRLGSLHRLFEPAQEPQQSRPAAVGARVVRRVVHKCSIPRAS